MDLEEVKLKIPPLYVYEIDDYIVFLDKITPMIVDNFNINNKNAFLKLNLSTWWRLQSQNTYLKLKLNTTPTNTPRKDIYSNNQKYTNFYSWRNNI